MDSYIRALFYEIMSSPSYVSICSLGRDCFKYVSYENALSIS